MKTLPLSEAKSQLSGLIEKVRLLEEQVMITRNGRPAAVLVSAEEFERWKETVEVRGDAALMKEIQSGRDPPSPIRGTGSRRGSGPGLRMDRGATAFPGGAF